MEELINKKVNFLLKQLGLKDQEIEAYMFLLREGESSVPKIAEKLKVQKSSAYFLIEKLKNKGFVYEQIRGKHNLISIDDPKKLKYLMEEKERSIRMKKSNVNGFLIPTLEKLRLNSGKSLDVRLFKGLSNVKKSFFEILLKNFKDIYALISLRRQAVFLSKSFIENFYTHLLEKECAKKFFISEAEVKYAINFFKITEELNYFDLNIKKIPVLGITEDIFLFGDNALFVNFSLKNSYAIFIKDKALSTTIKNLFKLSEEKVEEI
jgi:sugar-specific transcriptional regulator TrmB